MTEDQLTALAKPSIKIQMINIIVKFNEEVVNRFVVKIDRRIDLIFKHVFEV